MPQNQYSKMDWRRIWYIRFESSQQKRGIASIQFHDPNCILIAFERFNVVVKIDLNPGLIKQVLNKPYRNLLSRKQTLLAHIQEIPRIRWNRNV
jgi:hypothetical protein